MAAFSKFDVFVEHLANKIHDLFGVTPGTDCDTVRIYLSNEAPLAADTVKADIAEIATGNGYAGAIAITWNGTRSAGTFTGSGLSQAIVAAGGAIAQFRYVILYNDTPAAPVDPLLGNWDNGAAVDLADGETFNVKFNNAAVGVRGNIFTLA